MVACTSRGSLKRDYYVCEANNCFPLRIYDITAKVLRAPLVANQAYMYHHGYALSSSPGRCGRVRSMRAKVVDLRMPSTL